MVIIMRGISGSGKSTWIRDNYSTALVCSADHYFTNEEGEYHWNVNKLGEAHAQCLRKFTQYVINCKPYIHIIVDNTNTTLLEMAPYVQLAKAYGHEVVFQTMECDPEVAAERNAHGVPLKSCKRMADRLKRHMDIPKNWK